MKPKVPNTFWGLTIKLNGGPCDGSFHLASDPPPPQYLVPVATDDYQVGFDGDWEPKYVTARYVRRLGTRNEFDYSKTEARP